MEPEVLTLVEGKPEVPSATRALPTGWRWVRQGDVVREAQGGFTSRETQHDDAIPLSRSDVTK
ncbi:MAG: hypothetical protein ACR2HB_17205 [Dehalococcoidia bacterium]